MNSSPSIGRPQYPVRPQGFATLSVREARSPDAPKPDSLNRKLKTTKETEKRTAPRAAGDPSARLTMNSACDGNEAAEVVEGGMAMNPPGMEELP